MKLRVTADMVAYCFVDGQLKLLAIAQGPPLSTPPRLGGGLQEQDEDATHACIREVKEVGLDLPVNKVEQLMTVSTPGRDPEAGSLPSPIWSICRQSRLSPCRDDAKEVVFLDVDFKMSQCLLEGKVLTASDFAFDHYQIIQESIKRFRDVSTGINLPLSVRGAFHRL